MATLKRKQLIIKINNQARVPVTQLNLLRRRPDLSYRQRLMSGEQ